MEKKETKVDLGKEMVVEGNTIMKIDKPRGIATMERNPLIRFNKF